MKFLIDALGAPASSGGMRLYTEEIITAWAAAFPGDDLTVIGGPWIAPAFENLPNVWVKAWPNDSAIPRMFGQFFLAAILYRTTHADRLLSVSSIVSPFVPRAHRVAVVHDWRHKKNPQEFSRWQLFYRRLWIPSLNRAGGAISISKKTDHETATYARRSNRFTVENGRDHALRWERVPNESTSSEQFAITTFGHHSNKRPELVILALGKIQPDLRERLELTVLGARGEYADDLKRLARSIGVINSCHFPGYVDDAEYRVTLQHSDLVALVSSDEGFGLPVAEAQSLGIPVVACTDSGLDKIHQGLIVVEASPEGVAKGITTSLDQKSHRNTIHSLTTWKQAASAVRNISIAPGAGSAVPGSTAQCEKGVGE